MEFFLFSELVVYGRTEDGEEYTGERYFVVAQDEYGTRLAHHHTFPGCEVSFHPEEGFPIFRDVREKAVDAGERLVNRIVAAGGIRDRAQWSPIPPAYGSHAFMETNAYGGDQYAIA
jgi:hypothetical protein